MLVPSLDRIASAVVDMTREAYSRTLTRMATRIFMATTFPTADFEARLRASFARQRIMRTLGAELTRVDAWLVKIELPFA